MITLEQSLIQKVFISKQNAVDVDFTKIGNGCKESLSCALVMSGKVDKQMFNRVIQSAESIVLVDGGSNYFYQTECRDNKRVKSIVGDLDSAKPNVLQHYREKQVEICKIDNQNFTDFEKSLARAESLGAKNCICLGVLGGRMDHTLSAMHLTTKLSRFFPQMEIVLEGDGNLMYFLRPNIVYTIKVPKWIQKQGCGIISFNKAENVNTTGFKWNMGNQNQFSSLEWGKFLSTSNEIVGDEIVIKSSGQVFFVCAIKQNLSDK